MGRKREVWPTPDTSGTSEARRYPKLPEPKRHFVSPRVEATRKGAFSFNRDGEMFQAVFNREHLGYVQKFAEGWYSSYDGYNFKFGPYKSRDEAAERLRSSSLREEAPLVVADFNTLDDLIAHARGEGATHYIQIDDETHLYFQRKDGSYEKSEVWQKDGYWHTQGPGSRVVVRKPPENAKPIAVVRERMTEATQGTKGEGNILVAVRLDDPRFGSGPATVVSYPESVQSYYATITDRDGARDPRMRLWQTRDRVPVGTRISMATLVPGTGIAKLRPESSRRGRSVRDYIAVDPRDRQVAGPFKHYSDARKEADNAGGVVKFVPSKGRATEARRGAVREEARGEQYAQDQLQGEYFQDWIRDQLLEASRMPPEDVLPLETKRDAMVIARNMLQDLEQDAKRNLDEDAAFWKGFRSALDDSREWLADELLQIKSEMGGGGTEEARRSRRNRPTPATRRRSRATPPQGRP
jgi:hypothetical protein